MKKLYHIVNKSELETILQTQEYTPASLGSEGFVHLAYYEQLQTIISQFFVATTGVCLLEIDPNKLNFEVKNEAPVGIENDGNLYPHLYGPLQTRAVCRVYELTIDSQGNFQEDELEVKLF